MASSITNHIVNVDDGSTLKQVTTDADKAAAALNRVAIAATGAGKAAQGGGQALLAAGKSRATTTQENIDYGKQRSAGGTGAAARDFAQQAQGLGGLVRLYATFAANVFAVSAAFTALSKASDTTNMLKGLEQIGAQSGKNLTSLSKQVQQLSDNALSLAESMQVVAQASSAGIASDQILRLTTVAKQASLALGRDLTDSVSRLTRGITKIEPELLDELGILVKVDEATRNYARSVGKTAASVTDFEKRQAFANAVLSEGEAKFGSIKIDANPYSKLLGSLKDIIQVGLEAVNKVFGPLVGLLAQSPTALSAAVGLIGVTLLKQALPAIGAIRENAAKAAEEAGKVAEVRVARAEEGAKKLAKIELANIRTRLSNELKALEEQAQARVDVVDKAEGKLQTLLASRKGKGGAKILDEIKNVAPQEITKDQIAKLQELGSKQTKVAQGYANIANAIIESQRAEKAFEEQQAKVDSAKANNAARETQRLNELLNSNAAVRRQIELRDKAQREATERNIKSMAIETTQALGLRVAYTEMGESIKKAQQAGTFTPLQAGLAKASATASILTTGFIGLASSLQNVLVYVGLAVVAYELLSFAFSKNAKEAAKFSAAVSSLEESTASLNRTLDAIAAKEVGKILSSESVIASANAMEDLVSNTKNLVSSLVKLDAASSGFDRFIDGFKSGVGRGIADVASKEIASSVVESIRAIDDEQARTAFQTKLTSILGTLDLSQGGIAKAITKSADPEKIISNIQAIAKAQEQLAEGSIKAARELKSVEDSFSAVSKAYGDLTTSLSPNSPLSKLGSSLVGLGNTLTSSFTSTKNALVQLNSIAGKVDKLKLLDPATAERLLSITAELNKNKEQTGVIDQARQRAEKALNANPYNPQVRLDSKRIMEWASAEKRVLEERAKELVSQFQSLGEATLTKGVMLLAQGINDAIAKAGVEVSKTVLAGSSGTGTAAATNILRKQEIDVQERLINTNLKLIEVQEKAAIAIEQSSIESRERTLTEKGSSRTEAENKELAGLPKISASLARALDDFRSGKLETSEGFLSLAPESQKILRGLFEATLGFKAQKAGLAGDRRSSDITAARGTAQEGFDNTQKLIQSGIELKTIEADRLKLATAGAIIADKSLLNRELEARASIRAREVEKLTSQQVFDLNQKNTRISQLIAEGQIEAANKLKEGISVQQKQNVLAQEQLRLRNALLGAEDKIRLIKNEEAIAQQRLSNEKLDAQISQEQQQNLLSIETARLTAKQQLGNISETLAVEQQGYLDREAASLELNNKLTAIRFESESKLIALKAQTEVQKTQATAGVTDPSQIKQISLDIDSQALSQSQQINLEASKQVELANNANAAKLRGLDITKDARMEQAKYNDQMEKLVELTDTLSGVFGTVGKNFGTAMQSILKATKDNASKRAKIEEEFNKKRVDALKKGGSAADFEKEQTRLTQQENDKKLESDLDYYGSTAGAAASMFSEKTAAYKAFHAIEQALHLASLAMKVEALIADAVGTKSSVINSGIRATADGIAAVVKTIASLPFPANIAAGAAVAALVGGLISQIGGGNTKSISLAGMTSKDRQEVQGTGYSFVNGKKVENGGGVLGDASAKSASIDNSLKLIKDNIIDGLGYDKSILETLQSIDQGINKAAISLYSISGIRSGSISGLKEDFSSTKTTSGLAASINSILNPLDKFFGGLTGSLLGSIFGSKKVSTEILDSGIKLSGTFKDLMDGITNSVQAYETLKVTTTSKALFGLVKKTSEAIVTNYAGLDSKITGQITDIFANAGAAFIQIGSKIGLSVDQVLGTLSNVKVDQLASLRGLTGEDLEKEFDAIISNILDGASTALFSSLKEYQKFGEGLFETVVRVVDSNDKVKVALDSIGISLTSLSFEASESLLTLTGGLSSFTDQVKFFREEFLTEAERLAPVQKNVTDTLAALGAEFGDMSIPLIDSRDEFKAFIKGLDLTIPKQQELYASLIQLAPAFAEVYASTSKALSLEERREESLRLYIQILELEGRTVEAIALSRQIELDAMDELLRPMQKYIYALQDEADAKDKLKTAYENESAALKTTISNVGSFITSLKDFKGSLLTGATSILSPQDKYNEVKKALQETARIASSVANTDEQKAAKDKALGDLPNASSAFLEASRIIFASSDKYSADFNLVNSILDGVTGALTNDKTTAELQLAALDSSVSFLNLINTNTETTAQLLQQYLQLAAVAAGAKVGLPSDVSLPVGALAGPNVPGYVEPPRAQAAFVPDGYMGTYSSAVEGGPEITNFKDIDRAISANSSGSAFDNFTNSIVSELVNLRKEVAQLRAEQNIQTGDLIATSIENSDKMTEAVTTSSKDTTIWKERSNFKLV
jgi:hypothetical protein